MKEQQMTLQQLSEMRKELAAANDRRAKLIIENAEVSRAMTEAEALEAIGEKTEAKALHTRFEDGKIELDQLDQKIEVFRRGISLLAQGRKQSRQFELTPEGAKITQQVTEAEHKLANVEERRRELLDEIAHVSRALPEAEALQAIGESNQLTALRARLEEAKLEVSQIDHQLGPLRRGVSLLRERAQEARQKHKPIIAKQINQERQQLVSALINALENSVEINAQLALLEQEMRVQLYQNELGAFQGLVYPGLSHAWRADEWNMGLIRDVLHETQYSKWLARCAAADVTVPEQGISIPGINNPNQSDYQEGMAAYAAQVHPMLQRGQQLAQRVRDFLTSRGYEV